MIVYLPRKLGGNWACGRVLYLGDCQALSAGMNPPNAEATLVQKTSKPRLVGIHWKALAE